MNTDTQLQKTSGGITSQVSVTLWVGDLVKYAEDTYNARNFTPEVVRQGTQHHTLRMT